MNLSFDSTGSITNNTKVPSQILDFEEPDSNKLSLKHEAKNINAQRTIITMNLSIIKQKKHVKCIQTIQESNGNTSAI